MRGTVVKKYNDNKGLILGEDKNHYIYTSIDFVSDFKLEINDKVKFIEKEERLLETTVYKATYITNEGDNMKKGFTLAELLGVIVIIAAMALIVLPPVINQISFQEDRIEEATKRIIDEAVYLYIDFNENEYPMVQSDRYCITLDSLIEAGLLERPLFFTSGNELDTSKYVETTVVRGSIISTTIKTTCTEIRN